MDERLLPKLLQEICHEQNWRLDSFSQDWHFTVTDPTTDNQTLVYGYQFGINSDSSQQLANDKAAASVVLEKAQIPHVAHTLVTRPQLVDWVPSEGSRNFMLKQVQHIGLPVVIKVNKGSCGHNVFLCHTESEVTTNADTIFAMHRDVAISPFIEFEHEYRCIYLDGDIRLVYKKHRNPKEWRHNLSHGARPEIIESPDQDMIKLAQVGARTLGLRFCSVDIIPGQQSPWQILEINSGVMMQKVVEHIPELYVVAKELHRDVLLKLLRPDNS
jgi:glutathione synthase/RimK-type ligase-like ATP-grasp enzyme